MNSAIPTIPVFNLALTAVPALAVVVIYYVWAMRAGTVLYSFTRMILQLILLGYVLNYLFAYDNVLTVSVVFAVMLLVSGWIALYSLKQKSAALYWKILLSIAAGGLTTLFFITQLVLELAPWFSVKYMIPLGGMAFSNAMNTVCLAAERLESDLAEGRDYETVRNAAFHAAMIPTINLLFAAGAVSLPGVMTGQVLSGVEPLVAVRYQVMIMSLVLGATGISTACYLVLARTPRRRGQ